MTKGLRIRQATFADQRKIFDFLGRGYGKQGQYKFPARWRWLFLDSPFRRGARPSVWIALDQDAVVGQYCAMPVRMKLGERVLRGAWGIDFLVLPSYRGAGLGTLLMRSVYGQFDFVASLWSSRASDHIKEKLGAKVVSAATEFVTRAAPLSAPDADCEIRLEPLRAFGAQTTRLWKASSGEYWGAVERSPAYLNWKFFSQPDTKYEALAAWRGAKLAGWIAFRLGQPPEPSIGLISEVFTAPGDVRAARALYARASSELAKAGAVRVVAATSDATHAEALRSYGFAGRGEAKLFVHLGERLESRDVPPGRRWLIGRGDSDWDQFPAALLAHGSLAGEPEQ